MLDKFTFETYDHTAGPETYEEFMQFIDTKEIDKCQISTKKNPVKDMQYVEPKNGSV